MLQRGHTMRPTIRGSLSGAIALLAGACVGAKGGDDEVDHASAEVPLFSEAQRQDCGVLPLPAPRPACRRPWQFQGLASGGSTARLEDGALVLRLPPPTSAEEARMREALVIWQAPIAGDFAAAFRYRDFQRAGSYMMWAVVAPADGPFDPNMSTESLPHQLPLAAAGVGGLTTCCRPTTLPDLNPEPTEYFLTPGIEVNARKASNGYTISRNTTASGGTLYLSRSGGTITAAALPDGGLSTPFSAPESLAPQGTRSSNASCARITDSRVLPDQPVRIGLVFAPNITDNPWSPSPMVREEAHVTLTEFRIQAADDAVASDDFSCGTWP
jgi:hypothetical protein